MEWKGRRQSGNVQDVRGQRTGGLGGGHRNGGGGLGLLTIVVRIFGIKGLLAMLVLGGVLWKLGIVDPSMLMGGSPVATRQMDASPEYNQLSVRLELQADFYAGVWANHSRPYLEHGDIEEAMGAANAIGDDAIQKKAQGHVVPHSFTHGTSAQRMRWFKKGLDSGKIEDGDTFSMAYEKL